MVGDKKQEKEEHEEVTYRMQKEGDKGRARTKKMKRHKAEKKGRAVTDLAFACRKLVHGGQHFGQPGSGQLPSKQPSLMQPSSSPPPPPGRLLFSRQSSAHPLKAVFPQAPPPRQFASMQSFLEAAFLKDILINCSRLPRRSIS